MLILAFYVLVNEILPVVGAYAIEAMGYIMIIVIMLAGITTVLNIASNSKSSNTIGSTVVSGLFRGIGFLGSRIIDGIGWLIRSIANLLPRVYRASRDAFIRAGISSGLATFLAVLVTIITLVIII